MDVFNAGAVVLHHNHGGGATHQRFVGGLAQSDFNLFACATIFDRVLDQV